MKCYGWILAVIAFVGCASAASPEAPKLKAHVYNSGFELSHGTFNGMSRASDGRIYYVLCAGTIDTGAQMYSFDPATEKITHVGDLTEAAGEKGLKAVPQGKSHVNFYESNGKLYFATHFGYYSIVNGEERPGVPTEGYKPYPGGHFLAYDLKSGKFENLAVAPAGQGILAMTIDAKRGRLYGLTWPSGLFLRYDLETKNLKNLGPISKEGEGGHGETYRVLCRALVVDPADGSAYVTTSEGDILRYRYDRDELETVRGDNLRKDYFGVFDPKKSGHMGYNWRQALWYEPEKAVYATHGNSGYLLRFDPHAERVDVVERITSEPSRRSGMYDKFGYGYLGFALGPDGHTLYYLTGGAIYENGRPVVSGKKGKEDLHLVTYDIPTGKYVDHGAIFLDDGQRPSEVVNSIAVGADGTVYSLFPVTENGRFRVDLVRIRVP